jgi:hypothetical protein
MVMLNIGSGLLPRDSQVCQARELLHPADFELQILAAL